MTRILPGVIAMAIIVVASNILVQFLILDGLLTWGAFTLPFAFLVTDVMNRVYGTAAARKVIFAGLVTGIICSLIGTQITVEFAPGVTGSAVALRVAIASATAFLASQLLDVMVFNLLRQGAWWRAPLGSGIAASILDTILFFGIAFSGTLSFGANADAEVAWAAEPAPFLLIGPEIPLWMTLAVADWMVKISIAFIALVPFRLIVKRLITQIA